MLSRALQRVISATCTHLSTISTPLRSLAEIWSIVLESIYFFYRGRLEESRFVARFQAFVSSMWIWSWYASEHV
jgi:hypothetical protein